MSHHDLVSREIVMAELTAPPPSSDAITRTSQVAVGDVRVCARERGACGTQLRRAVAGGQRSRAGAGRGGHVVRVPRVRTRWVVPGWIDAAIVRLLST